LFDEIGEIAGFIEKIYLAYTSGSPIWINREGVQKYSRKELTKKMLTLWKQAIEV